MDAVALTADRPARVAHLHSPGAEPVRLRMFFIDLIDGDGGDTTLWAGTSYDDGIAMAHGLERDGVPVIDTVGDGWPPLLN